MIEINKIKNKISAQQERRKPTMTRVIKIKSFLLFASLFLAGAFQMPVFAAVDVSSVTKPINVIVTLIVAVVSLAGVIFVILGAVDLLTSLGSHDPGGIKNGLFKLAAGVCLVAIGAILTLMGITY